uniref:Uncharacterized protein n=1 Tax=Anguilla anguilla TaxID=7936 RepID=A0A0E9PIU2_ANGAN
MHHYFQQVVFLNLCSLFKCTLIISLWIIGISVDISMLGTPMSCDQHQLMPRFGFATWDTAPVSHHMISPGRSCISEGQ